MVFDKGYDSSHNDQLKPFKFVHLVPCPVYINKQIQEVSLTLKPRNYGNYVKLHIFGRRGVKFNSIFDISVNRK